MTTNNFWSNPSKSNPAVSMLQPPTTGDRQENPSRHMPGSLAGAIPSSYTNAAQAVYPWAYDPNEPVRAFNEATFPSWHSRQQLNFIVANGPVSIPPGSSNPQARYIVNADRTAVINVMNLTLSDYQRLSRQDRALLENDSIFRDIVAVNLGLTNNPANVLASINKLLQGENGNTPLIARLPQEDQAVFRKQLDLIRRRIDASHRIAEGNVQKEIAEIAARIGRAAAFASVQPPTNVVFVIQGVNNVRNGQGYDSRDNFFAQFSTEARGRVISSDDNATVNAGYASFMRLERDILTAKLRREALARENTFFDPKNDVAQLIYQLQLLYQAESTSISDAGTEEMSQLHRLLADYAVIQRLVNETLKSFDPKKQDEKRRFLNLGGTQNGGVDTDQMIGGRDRDNGQDTRIGYLLGDNPRESDGSARFFGDLNRSTDGFDVAPRYGWFLLGGTLDNPQMSNNDLLRWAEDNEDPPNRFLSYAGKITDRFSASNQNDVVIQTGGLTKEEMRIVSMFSKDYWASGPDGNRFAQTHPIEQLYNVTRARQNLTSETPSDAGSLRLERRDYWDKWSTQLSDNVTLLNQKNQLKQNEIENASKEANRHFDLGTNALKKMNEMLMAIGRM